MSNTNSSFVETEKTAVVFVSKSKNRKKGSETLPKGCKTLQEFSDRLQEAIRQRL